MSQAFLQSVLAEAEPIWQALVRHPFVQELAAGTLAPERLFRQLVVSRWYAFGWAAVGPLVQRPHAVLPRLLAAVRYRGEPPVGLPGAGLLSSIAVEPHLARLGIGGMLVAAYCQEAARQGLRFVYLTTDRDDNESSQLFYLRHGFKAESSIRRRDGRVMVRYVRALDHAS